jgi:hypothetical protein
VLCLVKLSDVSQGIGEKRADNILELRQRSPEPLKEVIRLLNAFKMLFAGQLSIKYASTDFLY